MLKKEYKRAVFKRKVKPRVLLKYVCQFECMSIYSIHIHTVVRTCTQKKHTKHIEIQMRTHIDSRKHMYIMHMCFARTHTEHKHT